MPKPGYTELVAFAVCLPSLAVIIASLAEGIVESAGWRVRIAKLGWDLCVLALGADGGIFGHPAVAKGFETTGAMVENMALVLLLTFASALGIIHFRKERPLSGRNALMALATGGAALMIPAYVIVHYWRAP